MSKEYYPTEEDREKVLKRMDKLDHVNIIKSFNATLLQLKALEGKKWVEYVGGAWDEEMIAGEDAEGNILGLTKKEIAFILQSRKKMQLFMDYLFFVETQRSQWMKYYRELYQEMEEWKNKARKSKSELERLKKKLLKPVKGKNQS